MCLCMRVVCTCVYSLLWLTSYVATKARFVPLPIGLPHHCDGLHRGNLRAASEAESLSLDLVGLSRQYSQAVAQPGKKSKQSQTSKTGNRAKQLQDNTDTTHQQIKFNKHPNTRKTVTIIIYDRYSTCLPANLLKANAGPNYLLGPQAKFNSKMSWKRHTHNLQACHYSTYPATLLVQFCWQVLAALISGTLAFYPPTVWVSCRSNFSNSLMTLRRWRAEAVLDLFCLI